MIEFQYFDGCPSAAVSLKNIQDLLKDGTLNETLKITEINDISEAEVLNFQGSPTILFNGIELYTMEKPMSYNYTCRVYQINGEQTGVLSQDFIMKRINTLLNK